MASNSRASGPSAGGSSASIASSISAAAAAMARGRERAVASAVGLICWGALLDVAQGGAGRSFHDRLDPGLGLGQLRFAMAAERGAALVISDGLGEGALAALERLHDLFKFLQ